MCKRDKELLLLGPCFSAGKSVGGIVVLFENLLENLRKKKVSFSVVDTNSANHSSRVTLWLVVGFKVLFGQYCHVSLHGTARDFLYFSPFLIFSKLFLKKNYSLRKFAGSFESYFESQNKVSRYFLEKLMRHSDANFFETHYLVNRFVDFNKSTFWFPNVREKQSISSKQYVEGETIKLLFLSQVARDKGVLTLIESISKMKNVQLTVAGPIIDRELEFIGTDSIENVVYVGVVAPGNVCKFMADYDCLVLPSFYDGEGYPGVIIEAFSIGLPVLTTNWRQIPELVGDGALLVEPNCVASLTAGIIDVINKHSELRIKSINRFSVFDDTPNTIKYLDRIGVKYD